MKKKPVMGRPRSRQPASAFDKMVGARVRVRRVMLGMSVSVFAQKIGRSMSQAYRLQMGDCNIPAQLLPAMAKALGCSVSDLVDGVK